MLNYTAGDDALLDLGLSTIEEPVGTTAVTYAGIETVVFDQAGYDLTIEGSAFDDTFTVAPQDADEVNLQMNGVSPLVHSIDTGGGGTLTIDPLDGADTIELIGSGDGDIIGCQRKRPDVHWPQDRRLCRRKHGSLVDPGRAWFGRNQRLRCRYDCGLCRRRGEPSNSDLLRGCRCEQCECDAGRDEHERAEVDNLPGGAAAVSYVNVEELEMDGTGTLTVRGTTDNDVITVYPDDYPTVCHQRRDVDHVQHRRSVHRPHSGGPGR